MNNNQELVTWFRRMGFTEEMPESFVEIYNNSTLFVWEQLMQTVYPKKEAEHIKRNIILNRLKLKDLNRQDEFVPKMKDVEIFRKKLALENKLMLMKDAVLEKQSQLRQLSQNCKLKEVTIDFLKTKISQNDQRKYLLTLKKEQLKKQDQEAEETLTKLKNVTPVEMESSSSSKEITETLKKCAEKLKQILQENLKSNEYISQSTLLYTTKKKKPSDMSSIASYMAIREKEDFEEISRSCIKRPQNKENISPNAHPNTDVKKNLFNIPRVVVENPKGQVKKRESLGILQDSFMENDSFSEVSKRFLTMNNANKDNSNDDVFSCIQKSPDLSDSVIFNFNKKSNNGKEAKTEEMRKGLYSNEFVNDNLHEVLRLNNRQLVYNVMQKITEDVKIDFTKMVSMQSSAKEGKQKINDDDIAKLHAVHIQTELKIIQQKRTLKTLLNRISKKKVQVLDIVEFNNEESLDLAIKQVGLDASLDAMKKEINSSKLEENDEQELQIVQSKILKIKNDIASKINLIQGAIEELNNAHTVLLTTKEKASSPLWHLRMFKTESDWMGPLLENHWVKEMKVFDDFPLEYQRQCTFTDGKTYYRDLCVDNYPDYNQLSQEDLQMLCDILQSPFSPPETVLLNLIKARKKLELLKTFTSQSCRSPLRIYTFEELQNQESYLTFAIDRLKTIMYSSKAGRTLAVGNTVEQSMKLWSEMPMKEFISCKRLVEGQTYQFYQNKLKSLL